MSATVRPFLLPCRCAPLGHRRSSAVTPPWIIEASCSVKAPPPVRCYLRLTRLPERKSQASQEYDKYLQHTSGEIKLKSPSWKSPNVIFYLLYRSGFMCKNVFSFSGYQLKLRSPTCNWFYIYWSYRDLLVVCSGIWYGGMYINIYT